MDASCGIADFVELLDQIGLGMDEIVAPLIDDALVSAGPDIEMAIEDMFVDLTIEEYVEISEGVGVTLTLEPSSVLIEPAGARLGMAGGAYGDRSTCVDASDVTEPLSTPGTPPAVGDADAHIGAYIDDDYANELLFVTWESGLLCYTATEEDIGIPLDSTLLELLAPGAYDGLFPEPVPVSLVTAPLAPPTAYAGGANDLVVEIDQLGLDFIAEFEHRPARIVGIELSGDAGVDLAFDDLTGLLEVLVDFDTGALDTTVSFNELAPGSDDVIVDGVGGTVDAIAGPLIADLAGSLAFPMPAFEGLGLTALAMGADGPQGDQIAAYADIGVVTYEAAGCDDKKGGCTDTTSCDKGCAASGGNPRVGPLWFLLFAVGLRRRA